ncbi:MAG: hypothetical protein ABSF98_13065 [Bryobacteraceae bacterium]|jgi:hypothetical protein
MPCFHVHRLREDRRLQFRLAPHTSGVTAARPKDFEKDTDTVEASSVYAAWASLRSSERPLMVGDVLEDEGGALRICKYTGFEEARWAVPEPVAAPPAPAVVPEAPGASGPALQ